MSFILFARWFGLISVLLSLGLLFNPDDASEMTEKMIDTPLGYIMGGVVPIFLGLFTLLTANNLDLGWQLVVILAGTALLSVGSFRVLFVKQCKTLLIENKDVIPFLFSLFGLMLGVLFIYVGFFSSLLSR